MSATACPYQKCVLAPGCTIQIGNRGDEPRIAKPANQPTITVHRRISSVGSITGASPVQAVFWWPSESASWLECAVTWTLGILSIPVEVTSAISLNSFSRWTNRRACQLMSR